MKTPQPARLAVSSDVLGELTVSPEQVLRFPDGLLGFPDTRDYVLVPTRHEGSFWLQSAEHPSLIFFLIDPFQHFDEYAVELSARQVQSIGARTQDDIAILAIVTLPPSDDAPATANLQGPLALNMADGIGRQVILGDSGLGVRRAIPLADIT
jgi:flagellar assembly factor FliW